LRPRKNIRNRARTPQRAGNVREMLWTVKSGSPASARSAWLCGLCLLATTLRNGPLLSPLMTRFRHFAAWCLLLVWGAVHALQLEHVALHHVMRDAHHEGCAHHHSDHETSSMTPLPFDGKEPWVTGDGSCPLCEWTGVPALTVDAPVLPSDVSEWARRKTLGRVRDGWGEPAEGTGIGWRGPPGAGLL